MEEIEARVAAAMNDLDRAHSASQIAAGELVNFRGKISEMLLQGLLTKEARQVQTLAEEAVRAVDAVSIRITTIADKMSEI